MIKYYFVMFSSAEGGFDYLLINFKCCNNNNNNQDIILLCLSSAEGGFNNIH